MNHFKTSTGETITTKSGRELRIIQVRDIDLVCVCLISNEVKVINKGDVVWVQKVLF